MAPARGARLAHRSTRASTRASSRASTRVLAGLVSAMLAVLITLAAGTPAVADPLQQAPGCPPVSIRASTKAAMAVFTGVVTEVQRSPRTDGVPGAIYDHTVTVDLVYQGRITTETVTVRTERDRTGCSLGALAQDAEYVFFVTGNGDPWEASGMSGTRPRTDQVVEKVASLLGEGAPPIEPAPETAVFTSLGAGEPQPFSRAAAPGAVLVVVGLLGLAVLRFLRRRDSL